MAAQISVDGTVDSRITGGGGDLSITGGIQRGSNLFHSFREFSVNDGQSVNFIGNSSIANIFTRVTGGKLSQLNGTLTAPANLYFINPAGINFGANARINVAGGFLATTASSMDFEDGTFFSATHPENSILTISLPNRLSFHEGSGNISVDNQGHQLSGDQPGLFPFSRTQATEGLSNAGSIALVGGEINLNGGVLST